jgi:PrtD family type I secretion system ABC transporter
MSLQGAQVTSENAVLANSMQRAKGSQGTALSNVLAECRSAFRFVFILTTILELVAIVPVLYMLSMYDRVLTSRSEVTLVSLTLMVFGVYVFWSGLEWIQRRMMVRISLRIDWDLAANVYDASFRQYVNRKNINVHQILGDLVNLRQFLTGGPLLALMSAPFALLFIAVSALFHPYLALFALAASALLLAVTYLTQKISAPKLHDANNASAEASRIASQSLRQAEPALALGMQADLRRQWHMRHQAFVGLQVSASEAAGILGGFSGFLTRSLPSVQMALGIWLAIEGLITGGMVIAATTLLSKAINPIQKVLANWKDISNAKQSYDRLAALFSEDEVQAERMTLPMPRGKLDVAELCVQPEESARPVLSGISFSISPGQALAIVGPSAAGKSSLVKSLVGIWRPTDGSVRLDGAEISEWAMGNLGRHVGYVPQEVEFFDGTVAENIARLGEVNAEKVVRAAQMAGMHETILTFPKGYDTRLGENGFALTGGQKQRLALARALYGDPVYVVMDEPNASLDEAGERSLAAAIKAMKARGASVVFTTHRPDLVKTSDYLLILAGGKQAAFGLTADLLAAAHKRRGEMRQNGMPTFHPAAEQTLKAATARTDVSQDSLAAGPAIAGAAA